MYWLAKVLGTLLLPPGIIILGLIFLTLAVYRNWLKTARFLAVSVLLYTCILSIEPVAEGLVVPLENWFQPFDQSKAQGANYIVVLGGGTIEHSPEYAGETILMLAALRRVDYAIELHKRTGLPLIFSGGKPARSDSNISEADAAKQHCIKQGVAESAIFMESKSMNTDENAAATKRLYNPKRIILVTSAYHMPRAMLIFSQYAMDAIPAPTDYKASRTGYSLLSFFPDNYYLFISSLALKEYLGLLFFVLTGLIQQLNELFSTL